MHYHKKTNVLIIDIVVISKLMERIRIWSKKKNQLKRSFDNIKLIDDWVYKIKKKKMENIIHNAMLDLNGLIRVWLSFNQKITTVWISNIIRVQFANISVEVRDIRREMLMYLIDERTRVEMVAVDVRLAFCRHGEKFTERERSVRSARTRK